MISSIKLKTVDICMCSLVRFSSTDCNSCSCHRLYLPWAVKQSRETCWALAQCSLVGFESGHSRHLKCCLRQLYPKFEPCLPSALGVGTAPFLVAHERKCPSCSGLMAPETPGWEESTCFGPIFALWKCQKWMSKEYKWQCTSSMSLPFGYWRTFVARGFRWSHV